MPNRPSPELFQILAERTVDYGIFLLDTTGHILSWNAGASRIKGYEEPEIIGKHFSIFYTSEDIARRWPEHELRQALTDGRFEDEGWRVKKSGARFWASVVITALRDDGGKLLAFSKITRDLSERKRKDEALRQSEERFRLLVDGVTDYAIYLLTPDGTISSWNEGARRIKGYEASEVIGKHFSRFYDSDSVAEGKPWEELAMAKENGRAENEGWRIRKDGTRFWARVVVTALHDADGRLHGFAKLTQDMTKEQHAQSLENATQQLKEFIAILAHELRNPLAPIRNASALLKSFQPGDPLYARTQEIIERQTAQLTRLVDDLLDVGRITRGTLTIDSQPTAVSDVVSRAVEAVQPAIDRAGDTLTIESAPEELVVDGDVIRLAQALTNLLSNAVRYTARGGQIVLKTSRKIVRHVPVAAISVRDNGQGIDSSLQGAIFGMFVQGANPTRRAGTGLGIGLALARSIVELHHGSIEVHSEGVGKGSEFIIELPLSQSKLLPREVVAQTATQAEPLARKRVLVVDDNEDAATMLAGLLQNYGHTVHIANDGVRALTAFDEFRPEFILLDIGMPGMDGLEVARRLRERKRNPQPTIVAVTGWGNPDDVARTQDAGFDIHLLKPVDEGEVLKILQDGNRRLY